MIACLTFQFTAKRRKVNAKYFSSDGCFPQLKLSLLFLIAFGNGDARPVSNPDSSQANTSTQNTSTQSEISSIDDYARKIDTFIKQNPDAKRMVGNISPDEKPNWRRFKTRTEFEKQEMNDQAFVWIQNGILVAAAFTFQSESGDWVHDVTYYYRENGSLAKIEARLNTSYGNISVIRKHYYNDQGQLLRKTERYQDLDTGKPKKPNAEFQDEPIPSYPTIKALPFYRLVATSKT